MRKYMSFLLVTAVVTGSAVAVTPPPATPPAVVSPFAFGFGAGLQVGDLRAEARLFEGVGWTNDCFKFKPCGGFIDIYGRAYFHVGPLPMYAQVGGSLVPFYRQSWKGVTLSQSNRARRLNMDVAWRERWTATGVIGVDLFSVQSLTVSANAGVNYASSWLTAHINEVPFGGQVIRAHEKHNNFRPSVGVEARFCMMDGWSATAGYRANYISKSKASLFSAFSGNEYKFEGKSHWSQQYGVGLQYRLPAN